jgi:BirA family transcriptional regulator, biotin operon repressor / biotin---[acetyl-CoA-carboxylase] ligase
LNDFKVQNIIHLQNNIFSRLFVGQNLITLSEVDSTNTYLKNILTNSKPVEGTVIMAESQYAGRGQQQNKWHSEPGKNLSFSILLNPGFLPIADQFDLTRVVSLGVYDALKPLLGDGLKIKWPNDVYYNGGKLGGILIENILQGHKIKHSVIGIGLNINQADFPEWIPNPVSVKQILQRDEDKLRILSDICSHIEAWYLELKNGKVEEIRQAYISILYWLNQRRRFRSNGEMFEGTIKSVKENGLLVVENNFKIELEFNFKQIEFLNK